MSHNEFELVLKEISDVSINLRYERGQIILKNSLKSSNPKKWLLQFRFFLNLYIEEFGGDSKILRLNLYRDLLTITDGYLEKSEDNAGYFYYINYGKKGDNLDSLYYNLVDNGFINDKIGLTKFRKVFCGEPFTEKIEWKSKVNELAYLIKTMIKLRFINCKPKRHWDITIKSFYNEETPITNTETLRKSRIPKRRNEIDGIISTLR